MGAGPLLGGIEIVAHACEDVGYAVNWNDTFYGAAPEWDSTRCECGPIDKSENHFTTYSYGADYEVSPEFSYEAIANPVNRADPDGAAINGSVISLVSLDPANPDADTAALASPDIGFRAPDELLADWISAFPFDDPEFEWVYAHVGGARDENCTPYCAGDFGFIDRGAYAVSALRPYVAYTVTHTNSLGLSTADGRAYHGYRVRLWVGVMHNFSFFVPPWDYEVNLGPWDTVEIDNYRDLNGNGIWDPVTGRVDARGRFVAMFTSLVPAVKVELAWLVNGGRGVDREWVRYACDPADNRDSSYAYTIAYEEGGTGDPSPNCFYYPDAWALDNDDMTSLLGGSTWVDVCIYADGTMALSERSLAALAFQHAFGDYVSAAFEMSFTGFESATMETVNRWFALHAEDLEDADALAARIAALRGTPEARYVIREFDAGRLGHAAAAARASGEACACDEEPLWEGG